MGVAESIGEKKGYVLGYPESLVSVRSHHLDCKIMLFDGKPWRLLFTRPPSSLIIQENIGFQFHPESLRNCLVREASPPFFFFKKPTSQVDHWKRNDYRLDICSLHPV